MNDQRSLYDQLRALILLANTEGLYDAADYLLERVKTMEQPLRPGRDKALSKWKQDIADIRSGELKTRPENDEPHSIVKS